MINNNLRESISKLFVNNEKCPCNMENCECLAEANNILKLQPLPRLGENWLPADHKKRIHLFLPGIAVTIDKSTSDKTIDRLLKEDVRIVHIQLAYGTKDENDKLMLKVATVIENCYLKNPKAFPIARAIEIRGRIVRTGRLRNDKQIRLTNGQPIILTSNTDFALCSVKEVLYLSNFDEHLKVLKIGDFIFINKHKIQLVIVKITRVFKTVTCCIIRGSVINSYMNVTLPYCIEASHKPSEQELFDCKYAIDNGADFVVIPSIIDPNYFACINAAIKKYNSNIMLLANIDLTLMNDRVALDNVLNDYDGIWINKYSAEFREQEKYIVTEARKLMKPVVSLMFRIKENLLGNKKKFQKEYAYQRFLIVESDCFLFKRFNRFIKNNALKLIAKNMPIPETTDENITFLKREMLDKSQPIHVAINGSVLTSLLLDGKLIIALTESGDIAKQLSHKRPMCPILTVISNRNYELARKLTLWKNIRPIVIGEDWKLPKNWDAQFEKQLKYGLDFSKNMKLVCVGDLVVYCYGAIEMKNDNQMAEEANSFRVSYVPEETIEF